MADGSSGTYTVQDGALLLTPEETDWIDRMVAEAAYEAAEIEKDPDSDEVNDVEVVADLFETVQILSRVWSETEAECIRQVAARTPLAMSAVRFHLANNEARREAGLIPPRPPWVD